MSSIVELMNELLKDEDGEDVGRLDDVLLLR